MLWQDNRIVPYLLTVVLLHASYITIGIPLSEEGHIGPALPVTFVMFIYLMWRSAVVVLRQGGVRWRDTFYPLDELRRSRAV